MREDQYNVTATVKRGNEQQDLGTFDSFSGGEVDSEETKYWPGGLQPQVSLGGRRTVGNVTISRLYTIGDHRRMGWLLAGAGKADVTITKTPIDVDGNSYGNALVYNGKMKAVTPPDHNSESSDAAKWEMEISSATVVQSAT